MNFHIDKNSRVQIYIQLEEQIRFHIATGMLKEGERLPSVRKLAEALDINLHTVAKAYKNLQKQGLIEILGPKGAFVSVGIERELSKVDSPSPLIKIADYAIQEAMRLGYDLQDLTQVIADRIVALEQTRSIPKIAFVECDSIEAAEHSQYLQSKLGTNVIPVELSQLEKKPDIIGEATLVVTTFFHFGRVKNLLSDKCEVVGVVMRPQIHGLQQLASLPALKSIGILCRDEESIPTMVSIVQGICPENVEIRPSIIVDGDAVKKMLSEVDAAIYTPPCRDIVRKTAPPDMILIEHKSEIDAESLDMLHSKIKNLHKLGE